MYFSLNNIEPKRDQSCIDLDKLQNEFTRKAPSDLVDLLEDEVTHSPDRNPAVQGSKLAGDWEILEKRYKDIHARLPVTVASTLLQTDSCIEMPLWLVQMFKVISC
ncbi:unnamed protein product [Brassica rapa]|uniref:Uncharacterized protein n=1 Tax=Brassica campestris TaxID=3711 RepID=A0A8D9M516_BRACM|nr:unnamed protein product [Brassica rapa]